MYYDSKRYFGRKMFMPCKIWFEVFTSLLFHLKFWIILASLDICCGGMLLLRNEDHFGTSSLASLQLSMMCL